MPASESIAYYLELNDFSVVVAVVRAQPSGPRIENIREFLLANGAEIEAGLKDLIPDIASRAIPASVVLRGRSGRLRVSLSPVAEWLQQPECAALSPAYQAMIDAGAGLGANGSGKNLQAIEAVASVEQVEALLKKWNITPLRLTVAPIATTGAIVSWLQGNAGTVALLDFGETVSHWLVAERTGVVAARASTLTMDVVAEAIREELGLRFKGAAAKLFFNEQYDFTEIGPKVGAKLAVRLKPELASLPGGSSALFFCAGLPAQQKWFGEVLAGCIGCGRPDLDVKKHFTEAGFTFASETPQLSPAWLGLLQVIRGSTQTPAAWVAEWRHPSAAAVTPPPAPEPAAPVPAAVPPAPPVAATAVKPPPASAPVKTPAAPAAAAVASPVTAKPTPAQPPAAAAVPAKPVEKPAPPKSPATIPPTATAPAPAAAKPAFPTPAAKPIPAQPAKPVPAQPSRPVPAQPAKPAPVQPAKPAPAQPAKPVPPQPAKPVPAQPARPAPAQPVKDEPSASLAHRQSSTLAYPMPGSKAASAEPAEEEPVRKKPFLKTGPGMALLATAVVAVSVIIWLVVQIQAEKKDAIAREQAKEVAMRRDMENERKAAEAKVQAAAEAQRRADVDAAAKLAALDAARQKAENEARQQTAARLANARGNLIVATQPAGANVRLSLLLTQHAPAKFEDIRIGEYDVVIALDGYEEVKMKAKIEENQTTDLGVITLHRQVGDLQVESTPPGAHFELRPKNASDASADPVQGTTPAKLTGLPTGVYSLTIEYKGAARQTGTVEIPAHATAKSDWEFSLGNVRITSTPSGATVMQAGKVLGKTPLELADLLEGEQTFELTSDNYEPIRVSGLVAKNATRVFDAKLVPLDRLYRTSEVDQRPVPTVQEQLTMPQSLPHYVNYHATVTLVVGKDGMPRDLVLTETSDPLFGRACLEAAAKWRFKPALVKGKPVSTQVSVPFLRDAD